MPTELLPSDSFDIDLDVKHQQFVDWELRARRSLVAQLGYDPVAAPKPIKSEVDRATDLRYHYMQTITDLGIECGIDGFSSPQSGSRIEYQRFAREIERAITRLRARAALNAPVTDVRLGRKTKGWLRQEIAHLMTYVERADIEEWRRKKLLASLADLLRDLDASRISYARIMAVLVPLAAVFGSTATGLAKLPDAASAIASIHGIIGHLADDHRAAEEERLRLEGPPPPALPAPAEQPAIATGASDEEDPPF